MEKLKVIYKDNSQLTVDCKVKGLAIGYWNDNVTVRSHIKDAFIQRYPKKNNLPVYLVKDGVALEG